MTRVPVKKTYKLYVGGAFPRSESGRTYEAEGHNIARASRKDLRDAVRVARGALGKWAGMTAYNRGQVLYRVAEMMEARSEELAQLCDGRAEVERSVDRFVWYAGWTDKLAQVLGGANPVAGPYFNFTVPEPTGVVGVVAPGEPALLGLVSRLAPVLAGGNVAVVIASEAHPRAAIELAEVLATSDVPGGVVNVLTGLKKELVPVLAAHNDVDALDTWGVADEMRTEVEILAAEDIKRLSRRPTSVAEARFDWLDDAATERPEWITAFLEMKTVWHPIGG
jgi:acyl-CoA reductase-like NAD-dependent aldehyde dehydrogenase